MKSWTLSHNVASDLPDVMLNQRTPEYHFVRFAFFIILSFVGEAEFAIDKNCRVWCDDADKESGSTGFCLVDEDFSEPLTSLTLSSPVINFTVKSVCEGTPAILISWSLSGDDVRAGLVDEVVIDIYSKIGRDKRSVLSQGIGVTLQENQTCSKSYNFEWIMHNGKLKVVKTGVYVLSLHSSSDSKPNHSQSVAIPEYLECEKESTPENICSDGYLCRNDKCINFSKFCDGYDDCGDNSDEFDRDTTGVNGTVCHSNNWVYSGHAHRKVCLLPESQIAKAQLLCKKESQIVGSFITIGLVLLVITLILLIAVLTSTRICVEETKCKYLKVTYIVNPGISDRDIQDRYTEVATALEEHENVEELRFNLRNTLETSIVDWLHTQTKWADVIIIASRPDATEIDPGRYDTYSKALMRVLNERTMNTLHGRIIAIRTEDQSQHSDCPVHKLPLFKTIQIYPDSKDQLLREISKQSKYQSHIV